VKPFQPEKLHQSIQRVNASNTNADTYKPKKQINTPCDTLNLTGNLMGTDFIGSSVAMQAVYAMIKKASQSHATVFITGESGTGKEVWAETIHQQSARKERPFVPINCGAIPRELIESELVGHVKGSFTGAIVNRDGAVARANGGTLFLDEIGEMPYDMQTKLLRFLQNGSFLKVGGSEMETTDARIICATNRNPLQEVQEGRFREDLYYRLHVLPIYMPPLHTRGQDMIELAQHFLAHFTREEQKNFQGFTKGAKESLMRYRWPGNIRQLQNTIRQAVVMNEGEHIEEQMLASELHKVSASSLRKTKNHMESNREKQIKPLRDTEKEVILEAIDICAGNIPKAAVLLDVSPSTLYRKKAEWV